MPRYKLTLEYDGTPFCGWQQQNNGSSVQGVLARAIFDFSSETVRVNGAGRTDAGVHALGQVAHIDLERDWPADTVADAINAHLRPELVAVLAAEVVDGDFDARFSAVMRHYRYDFCNRRAPLTFSRSQFWQVAVPLDAVAMDLAAQALCGRHDFTTFRAAECQAKSPVKTIEAIAVQRLDERVRITVSARSFLHRQVRSIAGSLKLVGEGRWSAETLAEALAARDRSCCGPVAPPDGLYLVAVDYD